MTAEIGAEPNTEVQRAAAWRMLLGDAASLSPRYRDRYAIVLAGLEVGVSHEEVRSARIAAAAGEAGRAASILAGTATSPPPEAGGSPPTVTGRGPVVDAVRDLLSRHNDVTGFVTRQPYLEQTGVPLHPSRQAHLVNASNREFVALRWPAGTPEVRSAHQERMAAVARLASVTAPLPVIVHDDYAVVEVNDGDPWVFAPNLGSTVEDRLRRGELRPEERQLLLTTLASLRAAMICEGSIWQGFAPRNMFLREGRLILIDFEEVVDAAIDPVRAAECLLWHRIFFTDCLTEAESAALFVQLGGEPGVPDEHPLRADAFERELLGLETVSWGLRRRLLLASAGLEGRHARPTAERDGGVLFGHELGHFWGDFIPVEDEARLFKQLTAVADPDRLVACLEVFEAAMEADICRMLRLRTQGLSHVSSPRTRALIEALDGVDVDRLAGIREETDWWYVRMTSDPGRLVDEVLHAAGVGVGGIDRSALDTYLVGGRDSRKTHEESLAAATRIGLDFIHRDAESFLNYRDPDDLAAAISEPLPREGADLDAVLADVETRIAHYAVSQSHPRYLAFPDSGNAVAAIAGGILSRLLNQNLIAVDRSAPSATFVEIQVIEWLRELIGYDVAPGERLRGVRDVAGLWATGGHLSNHLAMLVALGRRFPKVRGEGLMELGTRPAVVMAGPIAHYSHSDAAFHLGLGWNSVIGVGAEAGYTTDPAAVEAALADPPAGTTPFMVVGVAGNCRTTGLDDLAALADVCQRYGVWFHVDACHGGSLIFSDRLRRRHLSGIERADSVSLDPHKGLFTPYPSSYVVFRERGMLTHFSRHESTVMADGCWDLGLVSPFLGSRGSESLATWMLLRHVGVRHLGDLVESRQAHVRYLERRIGATGLFVRLNDVDFYRLAFVLCPPRIQQALAGLDPIRRRQAALKVSRYTSQLNTTLYRSGEVCFDEHTLVDLADRVGAGTDTTYTIMAACPGNPLLTRADLDDAVDRLVRAARPLVPMMLADITSGAAASDDGPPVAGPAGWSDGS